MSKINEIVEAIDGLTLLEVKELCDVLQEKYGITAAAMAPVAVAGGGAPGAEAAGPATEEKTEFDVVLTDVGANKIQVIKAVREVTTLGLKEAKDLVEAAPKAVKEGVTKDEAEKIKAKIEESGGKVEIK